MKTRIVILQTKVENQRQEIVGLENQLMEVRCALDDEQRINAERTTEFKRKIEWQKKRIANRDIKIKELQDG